jgi:hypothetical protein
MRRRSTKQLALSAGILGVTSMTMLSYVFNIDTIFAKVNQWSIWPFRFIEAIVLVVCTPMVLRRMKGWPLSVNWLRLGATGFALGHVASLVSFFLFPAFIPRGLGSWFHASQLQPDAVAITLLFPALSFHTLVGMSSLVVATFIGRLFQRAQEQSSQRNG